MLSWDDKKWEYKDLIFTRSMHFHLIILIHSTSMQNIVRFILPVNEVFEWLIKILQIFHTFYFLNKTKYTQQAMELSLHVEHRCAILSFLCSVDWVESTQYCENKIQVKSTLHSKVAWKRPKLSRKSNAFSAIFHQTYTTDLSSRMP